MTTDLSETRRHDERMRPPGRATEASRVIRHTGDWKTLPKRRILTFAELFCGLREKEVARGGRESILSL